MSGFKYPTPQEIVAEYLRLLDSGTSITEDDVISQHRQLEGELRSEFRKLSVITDAVSSTDDSDSQATSPEVGSDTLPRHAQPSGTTILRCPHCNKPTEAKLEGSFRAVRCESCQQQFSLIRERKWPKQVAHFELIERIGVGGFGSVWKARDRELDRLVAIKLPRRIFVEDSEQEQFIREAQTAAQLNHPNIVKVHEVGVFDGSIYIVSELIEGKPLSQHIGNGLAEKEAVRLAEPISRALHYAHECGVIHRDLKPQNVILGKDRKPYLSDFGLARRGDTDLSLTVSGQILGTPRYMSPEQARGDSHTADARSDIFSLGILVFELLTGQVPFQGTPETIFYRVQTEDPVNPRRLNQRISRDIDTICMKCLEKDPEQRYQTALEVAEELGRVAGGNPIVARPVGILERSYRWAKRNPVVASLTAGLLVAFVAATLLGSYLIAQTQFTENIERQKLLTEIRQVRADGNSGYRDEISEIVRGNPRFVGDKEFTDDIRTEVLLSMGDAAAYKAHELDIDDGNHVASAAICFDGSRVAIAFESGLIQLRDTVDLERVIYEANLNDQAAAIRFRGASSTQLLSLGKRGSLTQISFGDDTSVERLADLRDFPLKPNNEVDGGIMSARFSTDGRFVVFTDGAEVTIWNVEQSSKVFTESPVLKDSSVIRCAAVSPDGQHVAIGYSNALGSIGGVICWDRTTGQTERRELNNGRQYAQSIVISDDANWLAVGCEQAILFEVKSLQRRLFFQDTEVFALAFSPDSSYLAIDYISGTVEIWNRKTNTLVAQLEQSPIEQSPKHANEGVAFSNDHNRFLAWNQSGVRILDLNSSTERIQIDVHERAIPTLRFTPDGKRLISCSKDGSVLSWNPRTGAQLPPRITKRGQLQCVAAHPKKSWVAVAQWGSTESLTVWTFADGDCERLTVVENDIGHISGLGFSPDGRFLAASGDEGLAVWRLDISEGKLSPIPVLRENAPDTDEDKCLVFDNTGTRLFHADAWGDRVKFYDFQTKESGDLGDTGDDSEIDAMEGWHGLAFTSENRLVFVNPEGGLEVWNVEDMSRGGQRIQSIGQNIFTDPVIAVSKSGLVAGKIGPKTITLWDLANGKELYTLRDERNTVYSFDWSPDGTLLAVGLSDGGISIWDISKIRRELASLGLSR